MSLNLFGLFFYIFFLLRDIVKQCSNFALDPCCSEEKYFWFKQIYEYMGGKKKKKTLCANSSMNFIRAVCVDWMRRAFLACGSNRTFSSSLSPIAIVFTLWLQQNKTCIHTTFSLSSQCQFLTSTCKQRVS